MSAGVISKWDLHQACGYLTPDVRTQSEKEQQERDPHPLFVHAADVNLNGKSAVTVGQRCTFTRGGVNCFAAATNARAVTLDDNA
jgi:cold shock CspA family protein